MVSLLAVIAACDCAKAAVAEAQSAAAAAKRAADLTTFPPAKREAAAARDHAREALDHAREILAIFPEHGSGGGGRDARPHITDPVAQARLRKLLNAPAGTEGADADDGDDGLVSILKRLNAAADSDNRSVAAQ